MVFFIVIFVFSIPGVSTVFGAVPAMTHGTLTAVGLLALTPDQRRQLTKMGDKSVKVTVPYKTPHPLYGKVINRKTVLHVHDEKNETKVGDKVEVMESRPLSRLKRWRVIKVVHAAATNALEANIEVTKE